MSVCIDCISKNINYKNPDSVMQGLHYILKRWYDDSNYLSFAPILRKLFKVSDLKNIHTRTKFTDIIFNFQRSKGMGREFGGVSLSFNKADVIQGTSQVKSFIGAPSSEVINLSNGHTWILKIDMNKFKDSVSSPPIEKRGWLRTMRKRRTKRVEPSIS